jgi:hypothetical protein
MIRTLSWQQQWHKTESQQLVRATHQEHMLTSWIKTTLSNQHKPLLMQLLYLQTGTLSPCAPCWPRQPASLAGSCKQRHTSFTHRLCCCCCINAAAVAPSTRA